MDREQLLEVAERVEKATGPDPVIDAEIHIALGRSDGRHIATITGFCAAEGIPAIPAPAYTSSLDAAMQLVPEGWHAAKLGERLDDGDRTRRTYSGAWGARLHLTENRLRNLAYGSAPTAALALTAACLRARAALLHDRDTTDG